MKQIIWAVALLMYPAVPLSAQQANTQPHTQQPKGAVGAPASQSPSTNDLDRFVQSYRKGDACKDLKSTGVAVDKLYDKEGFPIFDLVDAAGRHYGPASADDTDSTWDELIDCANQTHSESERAESLQVAAMWELWRAENFRKRYLTATATPPHPASCENIDQLIGRAKAITDQEPLPTIVSQMRDYDSTLGAVVKCMNDSVRLSERKPDERYWSTVTYLQLELWKAQRARAFFEHAYLNTTDYKDAQAEYEAQKAGEGKWRAALADPSALIAIGPQDRLSESEGSQVSAHNRNLCDQIVTVAGLAPNGLALYVPPEGQRFMAKNSKNYPRMCLVQDAASLAPGVPRYLLVWAYSDNAFAGFQPVQQVTTAPVSGSGTVTNLSGRMWHFTYTGTETEIDTVEAPYVIQSRSLYLRAYDESGNLVSQHSITMSNMAGGDASYAAGYNAGALISALWNNPSHLITNVLKDVQKDSMKYSQR